MKKIILAYVPVLHRGYLNFFAKHPDAKTLYLLDESLTHQWRSLEKDLRALPATQIKELIEHLELFDQVTLVTSENINDVDSENVELIMPNEELNLELAEKYFKTTKITYDSIFLRWDKKRSLSREEVEPNIVISSDEFDKKIMSELEELTKHSSDWWRQVSAALIKDNKVIFADKNYHVPFDQQQYVDGDPRADFQSGELFELSSSVHAESSVIAQAAMNGVATKDLSLYTTTFPCPVCAKLIAESGIKKMYYLDGYSLLDGENVLKSKGVEIIKVELKKND